MKKQLSAADDKKSSSSVFRQSGRVLRHFASARALEIAALQAAPFLGAMLGGFSFATENIIRLLLLLLGSVALTAHIFVLNDWAGRTTDQLAPRRATPSFTAHRITSRQVACFAILLLAVALAAFALLGSQALFFGISIATLGVLYSCAPIFGKSMPGAASLHHLLGGSLHFLLGYTLFHAVDDGGFALSLFFGLVFAAGHLNQEIRDYEGDRRGGICTSAVVFGCRRTFFASLFLFSAAYALVIGLAVFEILPKILLLSGVVWLLHIRWSLAALEGGLSFETAVRIQRRYRILLAVVGLAMIFGRINI